MRLALVVLASLVVVLGSESGAGAAPARDATADEVAALLEDAVTDDGALAELRTVERIDGRRVDLRSATSGVNDDPGLRSARLGALAETFDRGRPMGTGDQRALDPDAARDAAAEVLDDRKYKPTELPRPIAGPLGWLADRLRPLGDAWDSVSGAVLRFADRIPGGRFLLFLLVTGLAGAAVNWLVRRRSRAEVELARASTLVDLSLDPAHLEREADEAEGAGDHTLAVRRRYEAGLLRLVATGRLKLAPATTASSAALQVDEPVMDEATLTFQEVVYGGREATASDSERARHLWSQLLGSKARR